MKIETVVVESFRNIVAPLTVTFDARLNVVFGPNETGKTTLAEAIWAALMLPAKGNTQAHKAMRHREHNDPPRVKITLRDGDSRYEITKHFSGSNGFARLVELDGQSERDRSERDEAEQRLRAILGVGEATRGELRDENRGLWGLTWVRHGEANRGPGSGLNPIARNRLNEQLGAMTEAVLAGEMGDRLFAAAQEEYRIYFTAGGAESRAADSPLLQARDACDAAKKQLDALHERQRTHSALVDEYERVSEELVRARTDLPKLEDHVRMARQAYEKRQAEETELEKRRQNVERAAQELALWQSRFDERTAWNVGLEKKRSRQAEATKKLAALEADLAAVDERLTRAKNTVDQRRFERDETSSLLRRARGLENLARARRDHAQLADACKAAQQHATALREARSHIQANAMTDARLHALEALDAERSKARAALDAAVARVSIIPHGDVEIRRDGEPVTGRNGEPMEFPVSVPTTLEIGAVATITVKPGQIDLEELRENVATKEQGLRDALDEVGAKNLADARRQLRARERTEQRIEDLENALRRVAPKGLEALQAQLVGAEARVEHESTALTALKEDGVGAGVDVTDAELQSALPERLDALCAGVKKAEKTHEHAQRAFEEARNTVTTAQFERAGFETRQAQRSQELKMLDEQLAELAEKVTEHVEKLGDDTQLMAEIARREQTLAQAQNDLTTLRAQLDERPLAELKTALLAAERNLSSLTDDVAAKQEQQAKLSGALTQSDVEGLDALIAEATERFEHAERALSSEQKRAEAAKCLFETMQNKRAEIEERYRAPLERRLSGLVSKMFPGAQVTLDPELDIASIHRTVPLAGETRDTFAELSAGASEQIGILARLAMAQTVAPEGGMPVLLDDSFVWTDESRFGRLAHVLHTVSENTQIIFLTCHWGRLRERGLSPHRVIDLAALRHTA